MYRHASMLLEWSGGFPQENVKLGFSETASGAIADL